MDDSKNEGSTVQTAHAGNQAGHGIGAHHELGPNSAIGRRLKAYYDDVASEPVPDRFLSLLDALDAAETAGTRSDRE